MPASLAEIMTIDDGIRKGFAWTIQNRISSRETLSISRTIEINFRDKATDDDNYSWRHPSALNNVELQNRTIRIAASEQPLGRPQDSIFHRGGLTQRDVDSSNHLASPERPTKAGSTTKIVILY